MTSARVPAMILRFPKLADTKRGRRFLAATVLSLTLAFAANVSADKCRPDYSGTDRITKKDVLQWQQVLGSSGFLAAALMDNDVTVTAFVARAGDKNLVMVVITKVEENLARAAFESRFNATRGDQLILGFKEGDPVTLTVTAASNRAQASTFSAKLNMTAEWDAEVSDADMAAIKTALTTRVIDAIRISQASGPINQDVSEKNGRRLMEKFACFYSTLDAKGIALNTVAAEQAKASGIAGPADGSQQLDLIVEDILAQDKLTLQAMMHHDMAYLDKHIADDAVFRSNGKQLTKRMLLARTMEQQAPPNPVKSRYSAVSSKTTGDIVEVTSTATMSIQTGGGWKDFFEVRGTTQYKKLGGEWVMLGGINEYEKPLK